MSFVRLLSRLALPLVCTLAACSGSDETSSAGDDLTSLTARTRTFQLNGFVYVWKYSSDSTVLSTVREQTQSVFGPLRLANIGTNSRELKDVDPKTFVKKEVNVIDPATNKVTPMIRIDYSFTDDVVLPPSLGNHTALNLVVLGKGYQKQSKRILGECTANNAHEREFEKSIWYVFNPYLVTCKKAIAAEQQVIDADRAKLTDPTMVPKSEVNRLYMPVVAKLTPKEQNMGESYPEYDRLYGGGVKPDRLVIGMVSGLMADWAAGEVRPPSDDAGYPMWLKGLRTIMQGRPELKLTNISPAEDLTTLDAAGKHVTGVSFERMLGWHLNAADYPADFVSGADRKALRDAASKKISLHWLTFEAPVTVQIGNAPAKEFTIELDTYFGSGEDAAPYKQAIKNSDVFIYNGHAYIGYGPLDPSRFTATDFSSGYQLMFINACVSYNYYDKDYFPLKGGSANLDLVTNGLESWVDGSGEAVARFVSTLINGKQAGYRDLLKAAQFTGMGYAWGKDALRVVDGELDNKYSPTATPITVTPR